MEFFNYSSETYLERRTLIDSLICLKNYWRVTPFLPRADAPNCCDDYFLLGLVSVDFSISLLVC